MGVEGFKGYFARNPIFSKCFSDTLPEHISSLFIDANGIFYKAAAEVYYMDSKTGLPLTDSARKKLMKKSKKNLEEKHLDSIIKVLKGHIDAVNPKDNLIIAVDGVVNIAKMNQQKPRRFGRAMEDDPYKIFDSTSLTPGTEFMKKIDNKIETWLENYDGYLPKRTIYSSHLQPGEGEHKIFDYVRRGDIIQGDGYHVINGLDNDLIILTIISSLERVVMRPEDGSKKLNVTLLRKELLKIMRFKGSDDENIIRDFCTIATLLGNDFLHKFPNIFHDVRETMKLIFKVYKFNSKHLVDKDNNIIWRNYMNFLRIYDNYNRKVQPLYVQVYLKPPLHPYKEIEENIIVRDKDGNKVNQVYDRERHNLTFNFHKFYRQWYKKQFNENILQWTGERVSTFTDELIFDMSINYLQTVQWVQYYYTKGYKYVSNLHSYHYIYNPLMGSVITVLNDLIGAKETAVLRDVNRKKGDIDITPIHQLLSVIPRTSLDQIPKQYRSIYRNFLQELNPEKFEYFEENYSKDHQKLANLPQVNIPYVNELLEANGFELPDDLDIKDDLIIIDDSDKYNILIESDTDEDMSISHDNLV